jgi:hypothetical protein
MVNLVKYKTDKGIWGTGKQRTGINKVAKRIQEDPFPGNKCDKDRKEGEEEERLKKKCKI